MRRFILCVCLALTPSIVEATTEAQKAEKEKHPRKDGENLGEYSERVRREHKDRCGPQKLKPDTKDDGKGDGHDDAPKKGGDDGHKN